VYSTSTKKIVRPERKIYISGSLIELQSMGCLTPYRDSHPQLPHHHHYPCPLKPKRNSRIS